MDIKHHGQYEKQTTTIGYRKTTTYRSDCDESGKRIRASPVINDAHCPLSLSRHHTYANSWFNWVANLSLKGTQGSHLGSVIYYRSTFGSTCSLTEPHSSGRLTLSVSLCESRPELTVVNISAIMAIYLWLLSALTHYPEPLWSGKGVTGRTRCPLQVAGG